MGEAVDQLERALFATLVESYPAIWSFEELALEVAADAVRFSDRDAVAVAVGELVRRGLVRRIATYYVATRPAVHAHRLVD